MIAVRVRLYPRCLVSVAPTGAISKGRGCYRNTRNEVSEAPHTPPLKYTICTLRTRLRSNFQLWKVTNMLISVSTFTLSRLLTCHCHYITIIIRSNFLWNVGVDSLNNLLMRARELKKLERVRSKLKDS